MKTTRRDMLKITAAGSALALVPLGPIPGLASLTTLEQLAAEGKYVSAANHLPLDWASAQWEFSLDGVVQDHIKEMMIQEVYAPGDDTGWAVVCMWLLRSESMAGTLAKIS